MWGVLPTCTTCVLVSIWARRELGAPRTGITSRCEVPCGCQESNPGSLEVQLLFQPARDFDLKERVRLCSRPGGTGKCKLSAWQSISLSSHGSRV